MAAHEIEERGILFLDRGHHLSLLRRGERGHVPTMALPAHCIGTRKTVPIGIPVTPVVTGKLTVNVGKHAGL